MNSDIKTWYFPPSNYGTKLGIEGSGLDQFQDKPYSHLAREVIQNSLDAKAEGKEKVVVEFSQFKTNKDEFLAAGDFFNYLQRMKRANPDEKTKENRFIMSAVSALNPNDTNKLCWLRISDFNTTGLRGATQMGDDKTPFFGFVFSQGLNNKGDKSGGSKGLGKNAIFVNSLFRSIFISTNTDIGEKASIGVAKLFSVGIDSDKKIKDWTQGIGYCVKPLDESAVPTPFSNEISLDPDFVREDTAYGTDIYVPGFTIEENWDRKLIGEAIISFMPAIIDGELEIRIKTDSEFDYKIINKDTLPQNVNDIDCFDSTAQQREAKNIFETITNGTSYKYVDKAGYEISVKIHNTLNSKNDVYFYRCPIKMKIEKLKASNIDAYSLKDCTAVVMVEGNTLAHKLRDIEDATHSKWSVAKWKDTKYTREDLEQSLNLVRKFVADKINSSFDSGDDTETDFSFLSSEGWMSEEEISLEDNKYQETGLPSLEITFDTRSDNVKHKKKKKRLKRKGTEVDEEGDASAFIEGTGIEDGGDDVFSHPVGHNEGGGGHSHTGSDTTDGTESTDGNKTMVLKTIKTAKCLMPSKDLTHGKFNLVFVPNVTGDNVFIQINKKGVQTTDIEDIKIISAEFDGESLDIQDNKIFMGSIKGGRKYVLDVELDCKENFVWEVELNGEN